MTEEEAKTKACCGSPAVAAAVLVASTKPGLAVEPLPGLAWGNCIGSACMAWRWSAKQPHGHGYYGDGTPHAGGYGHCGLAGAPQP